MRWKCFEKSRRKLRQTRLGISVFPKTHVHRMMQHISKTFFFSTGGIERNVFLRKKHGYQNLVEASSLNFFNCYRCLKKAVCQSSVRQLKRFALFKVGLIYWRKGSMQQGIERDRFCAAVHDGDVSHLLVYLTDEGRLYLGAHRTTYNADQKMHLQNMNFGVWHAITARRSNEPLQTIQ